MSSYYFPENEKKKTFNLPQPPLFLAQKRKGFMILIYAFNIHNSISSFSIRRSFT